MPAERQVALELAVAEKLVEDLATRTRGPDLGHVSAILGAAVDDYLVARNPCGARTRFGDLINQPNPQTTDHTHGVMSAVYAFPSVQVDPSQL